MPISSGTGILPVQMSRHDKSHGQVSIGDSPRRDARATGVAPIDPSGPANVSWRQTTSTCSRYVFIETALAASEFLGTEVPMLSLFIAQLDERGETDHQHRDNCA